MADQGSLAGVKMAREPDMEEVGQVDQPCRVAGEVKANQVGRICRAVEEVEVGHMGWSCKAAEEVEADQVGHRVGLPRRWRLARWACHVGQP